MSEVRRCCECAYSGLPGFRFPCITCTARDGRPNFEPKLTGEKMSSVYENELADAEETASATEVVAKIMDYSHPLYEAFDDAVKQATAGKGVRHGGEATPFLTQSWHQIAKHTGVGGLIFQMVKKAQEACGKDDQESFERELLGALVYGGAAYLFVKQHGFKKGEK